MSTRALRSVAAGILFVTLGFVNLFLAAAQQPAQGAPPTAQANAPFDPTGYWVSVISEDWRYRMLTPPKGDFIGVPLNAEGQKVANSWDYDKDTPAGNQCKVFGAGGLMRLPTRLRITWQDANTLKIESDAGQQTKMLRFTTQTVPATPTLQGNSKAEWLEVRPGGARGAAPPAGAPAPLAGGQPPVYGQGGLKVVTTNLTPGYLRKNGVPYSENAIVTEYIDRVPGPDGSQWLIVKAVVQDPTYLTQNYVTSNHFMLEPNASKWMPSPCIIDPPIRPPNPARVTGGEVR